MAHAVGARGTARVLRFSRVSESGVSVQLREAHVLLARRQSVRTIAFRMSGGCGAAGTLKPGGGAPLAGIRRRKRARGRSSNPRALSRFRVATTAPLLPRTRQALLRRPRSPANEAL